LWLAPAKDLRNFKKFVNKNSTMRFLLYFCALVAGALLPMQAGINAQLKQHLGTPVQAVCISVVVSAIALWLYLPIARVPFPTLAALASVPPWAWVGGGLCGAAYLPVTLVLAQRLGAGTLFALVIAGNMLMSVVLDHFGWLGLPMHQANPIRLFGLSLLVIGVILIRNF
jgi:bacterial/archaeal transporter family-2 protein